MAAAPALDAETLRTAKQNGFSDAQIAELRGTTETVIREIRWGLAVRPVYHAVDTCAAEFAARTPYLYSTYDEQTEVPEGSTPKVIILGSGPNRIGQGIEFDYACVHASFALAEAGYETVMVNCNPETVSTDYDTSGRLYFEPLTLEDVLEVVRAEQASGPVKGVIVQLGGQTPLGLARALAAARVPVVGTSPEAIHLAEDRAAFARVLEKAGLTAPRYGTATSAEAAVQIAREIGYPVLVRPSYVLGGRGMEIVYDDAMLRSYVSRATDAGPGHPVLIDRFLDDAIEIDVDALYDGSELYLGGVMEHIEEAGIHSGDSACALPPITIGRGDIAQIRAATEAIAAGVGVRGLLNVQYALAGGVLYVLEANPRASRTVPFVSKATAVPLAKAASRIMLGSTIAALRAEGMLQAYGDGGEHPAGRAGGGEGGGAAVRPVPRPGRAGRRHRARPGDALDRRGDGDRRGVRHRVREGPGRGVRVAAGEGAGVRVGGQPGQAVDDIPGQAPGRPGFRDLGHRGNGGGAAPQRGSCQDRAKARRRPRPFWRADRGDADPRRARWT